MSTDEIRLGREQVREAFEIKYREVASRPSLEGLFVTFHYAKGGLTPTGASVRIRKAKAGRRDDVSSSVIGL